MVCIVLSSMKPSMNTDTCLTRTYVILLYFYLKKKPKTKTKKTHQNTISYATPHDLVAFSHQCKNSNTIAAHSFSRGLTVLAAQKRKP